MHKFKMATMRFADYDIMHRNFGTNTDRNKLCRNDQDWNFNTAYVFDNDNLLICINLRWQPYANMNFQKTFMTMYNNHSYLFLFLFKYFLVKCRVPRSCKRYFYLFAEHLFGVWGGGPGTCTLPFLVTIRIMAAQYNLLNVDYCILVVSRLVELKNMHRKCI